jgi:hypothetical protein
MKGDHEIGEPYQFLWMQKAQENELFLREIFLKFFFNFRS